MTCDTGTEYLKQGRRENVGWIFSNKGALYMNKLRGLSTSHCEVNGNPHIYDHVSVNDMLYDDLLKLIF